MDSLSDVLRPTSHAGTVFSNASHPSTTPTSHANSFCSSTGDLDANQQHPAHGFSSHLKMLASASQSSIAAPACSSLLSKTVASQPPNLSQSSLILDPQQGHPAQFQASHSHPQSQPSATLSLQFDEFDEPVSHPHRPTELQHTASFYPLLDGHQLHHGHTLSAVPSPDLGNQPKENMDKDKPIDKNSPSEDDRFAEAIIKGIQF